MAKLHQERMDSTFQRDMLQYLIQDKVDIEIDDSLLSHRDGWSLSVLCIMSEVSLSVTLLSEVLLSEVSLSEVLLSKVSLSEVSFLSEVSLSQVGLSEVSLSEVSLVEVSSDVSLSEV